MVESVLVRTSVEVAAASVHVLVTASAHVRLVGTTSVHVIT